MRTKYIKVKAEHPEDAKILEAADCLRAGDLVAFPTETVYGLGALASNAEAVHKIFEAKERPAESPLLIHVSRREQVENLAVNIPPVANRLMDRFWPGPLSIILVARPEVPLVVRGGKETVGFRMPSHPVSIALIEAAGPIAAPSANLHGRPSPMSAEHVKTDLDGRIAAVLDAGETGAGLESTIVDLSHGTCEILRMGGTPVETIQQFLGPAVQVVMGLSNPGAYSSSVKVVLADTVEEFEKQLQAMVKQDIRGGLVYYTQSEANPAANLPVYVLDLSGRGNSLYAILRDAEQKGLQTLLLYPLDREQGGLPSAMIDRIVRAVSAN